MNIRTNGTQKESKVIDFTPKPCRTMAYSVDYDTTNPEETIRNFVFSIQAMLSKYEYNRKRVSEVEAELVDLLHYIEMADNKTAPGGYRLYKKLKELRKERRVCINENDLLQPIYDHFHGTEVIKRLTTVQGECSKMKELIDSRTYTIRTDILEEYLVPKKEKSMGINLNDTSYLSSIDVGSKIKKTKEQYRLAWKAEEKVGEAK